MTAPEAEAAPEPKYLVVQLSDLPPGFTLVPGETFATPLAHVLADPWSAGYEAVIRRERIGGYQTSFWSPERVRIECNSAVHRSTTGATALFRLRAERFGAFLAAAKSGRPIRAERIGDETKAFRFELRRTSGLTVIWRYRNILASCTSVGSGPRDLRQIAAIATTQQERIAAASR